MERLGDPLGLFIYKYATYVLFKNIIKYIPKLFELESKVNQQLIATMSNHLSLHEKVVIA